MQTERILLRFKMKSKNIFKAGFNYKEVEHPYYKYRLLTSFSVQTYCTGYDIKHRYFRLDPKGKLVVFAGYSCDGCSGWTFDTDSSMRGGFAHDPLYQILRDCLIFKGREFNQKEHNEFRKNADKTARRVWKSDEMWWIRYASWYRCLRVGGASSAKPDFTRHIKGDECDKLY